MTDGATMITRRVLKGRTQTVGEFNTPDGIVCRVLEPARSIPLTPPVGTSPPDLALDTAYNAGPTFVMHVPGGYADPVTGYVFTAEREFVRESAVVGKYADKAERSFPQYDFDNPVRLEGEVAVVSNQRQGNYCRWWLDTVSKLYLFETFELAALGGRRPAAWIVPPAELAFHARTFEMLGRSTGPAIPPKRLVQGDLLVSAGLTWAGGQNISPLVRDFGQWVLDGAKLKKAHEQHRRKVYITREHTRMRRMLNEAELLGPLKERDFQIVALENLDLRSQLKIFAQADLIVSPHGAGLTNVIVCHPGTILLEIFPDSGVHGSAFRRIGANLDMRYAAFTGPAVPFDPEENPRNIDFSVDVEALVAMIDDLSEQV